jgi:hypothetical protein
MTQPTTGEISEVQPGVFFTLLPPCSCRVAPRVLRPEPSSLVWLVRHMPHPVVEWADLPVPLFRGAAPEALRVRGAAYDVQLPLASFLDRVPRWPEGDGVLLLQMARPVPDTLDYFRIGEGASQDAVLRRNGWLLTFDLPHGGEYAGVTCPDRGHLERVLTDEVIAAGLAAGELP